MAVISDIIDGARWNETDGVVTEIVRLFMVTFPTPAPDLFREGNLFGSLVAVGIPQPGDAHPIKSNCFVVQRNVLPQSPRLFTVEVVYRDPTQPEADGDDYQVSISSTLEQVETERDLFGNQVTVQHQQVTQGGQVSVLRPRHGVTFTRIENTTAPGAIGLAYVGKTNDALWQSGAAGTWMLESYQADLVVAAADRWRCSYTFRYNPDGHDPQVVFIDPESGRPPPGLVAGVGYKTVEQYDQATFGTGGLNL